MVTAKRCVSPGLASYNVFFSLWRDTCKKTRIRPLGPIPDVPSECNFCFSSKIVSSVTSLKLCIQQLVKMNESSAHGCASWNTCGACCFCVLITLLNHTVLLSSTVDQRSNGRWTASQRQSLHWAAFFLLSAQLPSAALIEMWSNKCEDKKSNELKDCCYGSIKINTWVPDTGLWGYGPAALSRRTYTDSRKRNWQADGMS